MRECSEDKAAEDNKYRREAGKEEVLLGDRDTVQSEDPKEDNRVH